MNGQGTYTSANGNEYIGEYKDAQANGQGTMTFANGDKYVGEWKDAQANGQGTLTFANGDKYVGEFKDSQMHGQGTFTYADGGKYVGEWKDNELIDKQAASNKNKSTKKETKILPDESNELTFKNNNQSEQNNYKRMINQLTDNIISLVWTDPNALALEETWPFYSIILLIFLIVVFSRRKEKDEMELDAQKEKRDDLDNNHSANSNLEVIEKNMEPLLDEGKEKDHDESATKKNSIGFYNILIITWYAVLSSLSFAAFYAIGYVFFVEEAGFENVEFINASIVLFPIFYFMFYQNRKAETKCKKCGGEWTKSEAGTEMINERQTVKISGSGEGKKKIYYTVTDYWQYWKCKKCSDVTKTRERKEQKDGEESIY